MQSERKRVLLLIVATLSGCAIARVNEPLAPGEAQVVMAHMVSGESAVYVRSIASANGIAKQQVGGHLHIVDAAAFRYIDVASRYIYVECNEPGAIIWHCG